MSGFSFRPAVREQVGLLIGLIGPSGGGKTYTAMRLARGICGDKPFAVIDTEAGRAKHYADLFKFDHGDLKPLFRPDAYAEAIKAADDAGYGTVIVDSCSHEWAGEGGILDWQEEELTRMAGDDYRKRESCKMASWIKPKMSHKQMIQRLLQVRANLILCFRAEERIKMEKDANGKIQIIPLGFQPVCSKEMPYELTVSFLLTPDKPGIPQPIKLQEQHRALFPLDKQISEESGRKIAEWAAGGAPKKVDPTPSTGNKTITTAILNVTKVKDKDDYKIFGTMDGNEKSFKCDIHMAEKAKSEKGTGMQFRIEYDPGFNIVSMTPEEKLF